MHSEKAGPTYSIEETEQLTGGDFSVNGRLQGSKKRSQLGERHRGSRTRLTVSAIFLAMGALAVVLIPLVSVGFTMCLRASAPHRAAPRGMLGGTLRRLAKREEETDPSSAFSSGGRSADDSLEAIPVAALPGNGDLNIREGCRETIWRVLGEYSPHGEAVPVDPPVTAGDGSPRSGARSRRQWARWLSRLPLQKRIYIAAVVSISSAALVIEIVAAATTGDDTGLLISATALAASAVIVSLLPVAVYGARRLNARLQKSRAQRSQQWSHESSEYSVVGIDDAGPEARAG